MKLFLYNVLCELAGSTERGLTKLGLWLIRPVRMLRTWAWHACARENLRTCNTRQTRETF
jgi:hypothetical protein